MGLDMVELALRIEEEFNIVLPDADLEKLRTPRDVAILIDRKYEELHKDKCSSQVGFYKVRKIFMETLGYPREALKPTTQTQELLGENIGKKWRQLKRAFPYSIDRLQFSKKVSWALLGVSFTLSLILYFAYALSLSWLLFLFLSVWGMLVFIARPFFATVVPNNLQTLSSFIRYTGEAHRPNKYRDLQAILDKVIEISIDQLALDPKKITPDSRYVEDLGAD
ncbi:hypothetical protein MNB_SV-4-1206 [hydrothermal vent metagenome]|uniref:Carrier domain-containing protein n=1 Tax=hydrothermal vent metagenome TaxID=652676 RepID=A0A1W1E8E0_9ZZZZ